MASTRNLTFTVKTGNHIKIMEYVDSFDKYVFFKSATMTRTSVLSVWQIDMTLDFSEVGREIVWMCRSVYGDISCERICMYRTFNLAEMLKEIEATDIRIDGKPFKIGC
ncbi:MAG: hypothetical protein GY841_18595 [FCB group bacterium]|nr:hypothetical protein [FCB group bacterium]